MPKGGSPAQDTRFFGGKSCAGIFGICPHARMQEVHGVPGRIAQSSRPATTRLPPADPFARSGNTFPGKYGNCGRLGETLAISASLSSHGSRRAQHVCGRGRQRGQAGGRACER